MKSNEMPGGVSHGGQPFIHRLMAWRPAGMLALAAGVVTVTAGLLTGCASSQDPFEAAMAAPAQPAATTTAVAAPATPVATPAAAPIAVKTTPAAAAATPATVTTTPDALSVAMRAAAMTDSAGGAQAQAPDYATNLLEQGDLISIMFRYSTNFNTIEKVGIDGTVNLAVAGQVKAAGQTLLQFQDNLTKLYASQAKDDPITVKLVTPEAAIYITGAVNRPGKIAMERPMTVLEAIMEAGGSVPLEADLSDVLVLRVNHGVQDTYHFNVRRVLDGKDTTVFYLKPFDIVRVPERVFNY